MIRLLWLFSILVVAGCNKTTTTSTAATAPVETFPYVRVGAEVDKEGNLLEAYAFGGDIDVEQLKRFAKTKRKLADARTFYSLYLFDAAENVRYPTDPSIATGFNVLKDEDVEAMKHVRAIYNTTNFNNHSQLTVYERNSSEGPSQRYEIH